MCALYVYRLQHERHLRSIVGVYTGDDVLDSLLGADGVAVGTVESHIAHL